jgi:iron complex outermembrane receptor protein
MAGPFVFARAASQARGPTRSEFMQQTLLSSRARGPAVLALCALSLPAALAQGSTTPQLATVEVFGGTGSSSLRATDADGAKTALPLRELPQSVRTLTRQAIDDLNATRLDDVLDHAGGVSRQTSFGGLWEHFALRGLPGNETTGMATLLNGFAGNRGLSAPRDLAGIERVEFLKGPAAALYGASEAGGILNLVSKRPRWKAAHTAQLQVGSHAHRRATLDSTGPMGESVAYRLNVAVEDADSFREFVHTRRQVLAPALTWKLGPQTVLEYTGEVLRHATPLDRGVVAVGNTLGAVPRERFLGEPADGDATVRNDAHQMLLSHDLSGGWQAPVGRALRSNTLHAYSSEGAALESGRTLTRMRRLRDYDSDDAVLQAEAQGTLHAAGAEHELLLGMESYRFRDARRLLRVNPTAAAPYAIDIFEPVYGQPQPTPLPLSDTRERQRGLALYLQDVVKLGPNWRLVAGARADQVRQSLDDQRSATRSSQEPTAVSPRLGLSWLPTTQWTVYANAGRSFRPNAGSDWAGRAFDPERGRALEVGAKWESADRRLGAGAALFDIRKRNLLTTDPVHSGFSLAAGAVRSRGAEFDLAGQVSAHWRVTGTMALHDVRVARDNTLEPGGRLLNVPRVTASLLAVYEDALAAGGRWGAGAGLSYVGKRLGEPRTQAQANAGATAFELPAYATTRLQAHWRPNERWRFSLGIENLFDKTYYPDSYSRLWVTPGTPRTLTLGLEAKLS